MNAADADLVDVELSCTQCAGVFTYQRVAGRAGRNPTRCEECRGLHRRCGCGAMVAYVPCSTCRTAVRNLRKGVARRLAERGGSKAGTALLHEPAPAGRVLYAATQLGLNPQLRAVAGQPLCVVPHPATEEPTPLRDLEDVRWYVIETTTQTAAREAA